MKIKISLVTACIVLLSLMSHKACADSPDFFGVSGWILHSSQSQFALGTPFIINNTNTMSVISSTTNSPILGQTGWYSEVLGGSRGNMIDILSWNSSHYGHETLNLTGDMEKNITMNLSRPPELNISIIYPPDDEILNEGTIYKLNVSVGLLGSGSAQNCTFAASFGGCLNVSAGDDAEHFRSTVSASMFETWNITGICAGLGNITVTSVCDTDSYYFEGITSDFVSGINVTGSASLIVEIIFPDNDTQIKSTNNVSFSFNVSGSNPVENCSLLINTLNNDTIYSPEQNVTLNFSALLGNRDYNWSIDCYDGSTFGTSGVFNLSIRHFIPSVSPLTVTGTVDLLAGSSKVIYCNGTANDRNGFADIASVNATFYFIEGGYSSEDADDENSHYSSPCNTFNPLGNSTDFSCNFSVFYYAPPGEWECNVSAFDYGNDENSTSENITINPLYAMNLPLSLDYGNLDAGDVSPDANLDIQNIGNMNISIAVKGYGDQENDNLSMVCQNGNISVANERFHRNSGISFNSMGILSAAFSLIPGLSIAKQIDLPEIKSVYWKIFAEPGIKGTCNGSIVLSIST